MPKHFAVELITSTSGKSGDKTIDPTHIFCTKTYKIVTDRRKEARKGICWENMLWLQVTKDAGHQHWRL